MYVNNLAGMDHFREIAFAGMNESMILIASRDVVVQ